MPRERKSEDVSLMQGVANRIKAVMVARGLNQGQVASYACVPPGVLSGLLKGTKDQAAFSTVYKIAKGLHVSLDELAGTTPLQIPEAPAQPVDRLAALEDKVERLVKALAPALAGSADILAQGATQPQSAGTRQRQRTGTK